MDDGGCGPGEGREAEGRGRRGGLHAGAGAHRSGRGGADQAARGARHGREQVRPGGQDHQHQGAVDSADQGRGNFGAGSGRPGAARRRRRFADRPKSGERLAPRAGGAGAAGRKQGRAEPSARQQVPAGREPLPQRAPDPAERPRDRRQRSEALEGRQGRGGGGGVSGEAPVGPQLLRRPQDRLQEAADQGRAGLRGRLLKDVRAAEEEAASVERRPGEAELASARAF
mmetsp:Transcript_88786/g.259504  ORF Transcript_88786/g.259504 Transcript_88786/m.259504 type:complete len:228 (-) Transcript_88786:116-799(-)